MPIQGPQGVSQLDFEPEPSPSRYCETPLFREISMKTPLNVLDTELGKIRNLLHEYIEYKSNSETKIYENNLYISEIETQIRNLEESIKVLKNVQ